MIIDDVFFNCELYEVLDEVDRQLEISPFAKRRDSKGDIMVCCPYHHDTHPSAGVRKSDGMFHCFACQETHTLPELITHCFGHTDDILGKFGWNWLLKNFATLQVEDRQLKPLEMHRGEVKAESIEYVSEEELDSYRYYHPYWAKRGITDERIIECFDLGYDIATKSITFPIRNIEGKTLFVARRSVQTKFFNYPEGVEKPLYGLYELYHSYIISGSRNGVAVVVVESMIDCLRLWQNNKPSVALNGLGNELQMQQLRDLPCRKLILATDNDKAGIEARAKIKSAIKNKIISYYEIPDGKKDIGELTDDEIKNLKEYY